MRKIIFSLILLSSIVSNGQEFKSIDNREILPSKFVKIIWQGDLKENFVDSILVLDLDSLKTKKYLNTYGYENKHYKIYYHIGEFLEQLNVLRSDTLFFVNEYEYQLYQGLYGKNKFDNDSITIKLNILNRANGIEDIKFSDNFSGYYTDKILDKSDLSFDIGLGLFKVGFTTSKVDKYIKLVEINDYHQKNEIIPCLFFIGDKVNGVYNGKKDLIIERYRFLLFRPTDCRLLSDEIVSPIVVLYDYNDE